MHRPHIVRSKSLSRSCWRVKLSKHQPCNSVRYWLHRYSQHEHPKRTSEKKSSLFSPDTKHCLCNTVVHSHLSLPLSPYSLLFVRKGSSLRKLQSEQKREAAELHTCAFTAPPSDARTRKRRHHRTAHNHIQTTALRQRNASHTKPVVVVFTFRKSCPAPSRVLAAAC